MIENFEYKKK